MHTPVTAAGDIAIELRRGAFTPKVNWPMTGTASCAAWVARWVGEPRMNRVDPVRLAVALEMRAGTDTAICRSNKVFGGAIRTRPPVHQPSRQSLDGARP
jgi:hypothetical protein